MSATIAAIASGPGRGGVGLLRLSGPVALEAALRISRGLESPTARVATRIHVLDVDGAELDDGLALWFPAPRSFTGEQVVELHLHGSPRLLSRVLERLLEHPGVRLAEPGEFTRRALLAGKLDLTQAEAVADLVDADSVLAVRAAAAQLGGAVSSALRSVREPLFALRADVEAALDFPEEAHDDETLDASRRLTAVRDQVSALRETLRAGALVRRGARVVLFGPVNAGKSSLFNALVGEDRALVDEEAGTTRDVLEARLEWSGLGLTLIDTAGLRDGAGRLEAKGIARTHQSVASADVAVLVVPIGEARHAWSALVPDGRRLDVSSKAEAGGVVGGLAVSVHRGQGVEDLRDAIRTRLLPAGAGVLAASERVVEGIGRLHDALNRAAQAADASTLEVVAGELAIAAETMGALTGEDVSAELVDSVFRRFCIGK